MTHFVMKNKITHTHSIGIHFPLGFDDLEQVEYIQSSDRELKVILSEVDGIPKIKNDIIRWYGDHAKFIASFLYGKYPHDY